MLVNYENLEIYVEKLETISKESEVFITVVKNISEETGLVEPVISIGVIDKDTGNGLIHLYNELDSFQIIPEATFNLMPNPEDAKKKYTMMHDGFENKIKQEYDKLIKILKDNIGFKNIIENASIIG